MPTYEYICNNAECQHEFEIFQSMKDDSLKDCPECGQPTLKRKIGLGAGIIFKGSGFYETDYKRKNGTPSGTDTKSNTENSKSSSSDKKPDSGKKPETTQSSK